MKKLFELRHNYTDWGVAKYGIDLQINPTTFTFRGRLIIDVEDNEQGVICGIGVANADVDNNIIYYFTAPNIPKRIISEHELVGHVVRTDSAKMLKNGFNLRPEQVVYDTAIGAHILNPARRGFGLKDLAKELGVEYPSYEEITGRKDGKTTLDKLPVPLVANYNACDVYATKMLYLQDYNKVLPRYEKRMAMSLNTGLVLNDMEQRGIALEERAIVHAEAILHAKKEELTGDLQNELGAVNLTSSKQVLEGLAKKSINPTYKRKPSIDKRGLIKLADKPIIQKLLSYSEVDTLISSFVNVYKDKGGELRPFFSQTATRTGRLAAYKPNLMQVPVRGQYAKLIKDMFVAREGKTFLEADYGQIEPRILAHSSGSISLCRLFREGADFHTFTADRLKIPRQTAKVLNLSVGYLASEYSVSDQLKCGLEEAKEQIEKWWALFPDLRMWIYQYLDKVRQSGYVTTLLGLKIPVEGLCDNNQYKRGAAERQAINNLCQGSAQEIMQLGMYELYKSGYHILLQIHDSVLLEEPTSHLNYLDIHSKLTDVYKLRVPLTISIKTGLAWGCMDKVEEKKYVSRV